MPKLKTDTCIQLLLKLSSIGFKQIRAKTVIDLDFHSRVRDCERRRTSEVLYAKLWKRFVGEVELSIEFVLFERPDID